VGRIREDGTKKLKSSAVPSIFFHKKTPNHHRKSSKKRLLNSIPSPLKRSKFIVSEHNYSQGRI
jgi:hypothetical protein